MIQERRHCWAMAWGRSRDAEHRARHGLRWRPREDRQSSILRGTGWRFGGAGGRQGPGGSSRELAPVASFSLWLGLGAVAEEGRDLGLRSMEKDAPHAQRERAGDSEGERLSL